MTVQSPATTCGILFTDVEGSTRRWEDDPNAMGRLMAEHDRVLAEAIADAGGRVVKGTGDGILAVFPSAAEAVGAAIVAQRKLWPDPPQGLGLPVRMAIHTGEVQERDGDVFGPAVIRCSRLMLAGHGGQVLVSGAARAAIDDGNIDLVDLGAHHLRDLADPVAVHRVVVPDLPSDFPALRTLHAFSHNLPTRLSSFVGRESELRQIPALLDSHRLVTLSGPGGTGKTRLALQVAAESLDRFPDGVWLVDLLQVGPDDHLAEALAAQLGIDCGPEGALAAMTVAFGGSATLLVMDNCEHVRPAATELVDALLSSTRQLRLLTTSREPLHLRGESIVGVDPLPLPEADDDPSRIRESPAVELFRDRAAEAGWDAADEQIARVGEICRAVDGLPLAIELAAARTRFMSVHELVNALPGTLDVLRSPSDTDRRHRTIRATIEWSYELLKPEERLLLNRLSAFRHGWWRDEAVSVCSAPPLTAALVDEALDGLVDQSLVTTAVTPHGATRFRLLEQVRQFAAEQEIAGDAAEMGRRLVDYYLDLVRTRGHPILEPLTAVDGDWAAGFLPVLIGDLSNLVTAIETALETGREVDALAIIADGAWLVFYAQSGYAQRYLSWLDRGLAAVTAQDPVTALGALEGAVWAISATIEQDTMLQLQLDGLRRAEALDHGYGRVDAHVTLGHAYWRVGRLQESRRHFLRAIELARDRYPNVALEAELSIAVLLENSVRGYEPARRVVEQVSEQSPLSFMDWYFAATAIDAGHLDEALAACDRALRSPIHRLMPVAVCHLQDRRGRVLAMRGRQDEAEDAAGAALDAARTIIGPNWAVPMAWQGAALVAEYADDPSRAASCLRRGLEMARRGRIDNYVCRLCLDLIPHLLDDGQIEDAEAIADEAERSMAADGDPGPFYGPMIRLGQARLRNAQGRAGAAARLVLDSLPHAIENAPTRSQVVSALEVGAMVMASTGDGRARSVLAAVDHWEVEAHMVGNPVVERRRERTLSAVATRPPDDPISLDQAVEVARVALGKLDASAR